MSFQISPKQALALYHLLFTGEEPLQSNIPPGLSAGERSGLVAAGLIQLKKVAKKRGQLVSLTDKAWEWAEANLGTELSKSGAAAVVLQHLLKKLSGHLKANDLRLASLLANDSVPDVEAPIIGEPALVRQAYLALSGGRLGVPVRISHLRHQLPKMEWQSLERLLWSMADGGKVFFSHFDDPQSLTADDHAFALVAAGHPRHLIIFPE